jgi:hypothetical protein
MYTYTYSWLLLFACQGGPSPDTKPHSSAAAVTMLAVLAIAGLTVNGRFVEGKGAAFATAATSVDAKTACSPGCRGRCGYAVLPSCHTYTVAVGTS